METFASASENKTDNIFLEENPFNTQKATETTYKIFWDYLTEKQLGIYVANTMATCKQHTKKIYFKI